MGRINPSLNLNKSPQDTEDYSLVFAKNIKVNKDGSISRENAIKKIYKNQHRIYKDNHGIFTMIDNIFLTAIAHTSTLYIVEHELIGKSDKLVITPYYENTKTLGKKIYTGANYHNGKVDGVCTTNLKGEVLLTINEYDADIDVPLRTINLNECQSTDDESTYTQSPNVPISNLYLIDRYNNTILNGVYQFFIRWEIHKNVYTPWMVCSKQIYAGNHNIKRTHAGSVNYINTSIDCNESFIFKLDVSDNADISKYKSFQLGYIISTDDTTKAKIWKKFDTNSINSNLYFTYDNLLTEDTDINEMLASIFNLYNVKNVVPFKDKLYVSNYKETNFNDENLRNFYDNHPVTIDVDAIKITDEKPSSNVELIYNNSKGYIEQIKINDEAINANDYVASILEGDTYFNGNEIGNSSKIPACTDYPVYSNASTSDIIKFDTTFVKEHRPGVAVTKHQEIICGKIEAVYINATLDSNSDSNPDAHVPTFANSDKRLTNEEKEYLRFIRSGGLNPAWDGKNYDGVGTTFKNKDHDGHGSWYYNRSHGDNYGEVTEHTPYCVDSQFLFKGNVINNRVLTENGIYYKKTDILSNIKTKIRRGLKVTTDFSKDAAHSEAYSTTETDFGFLYPHILGIDPNNGIIIGGFGTRRPLNTFTTLGIKYWISYTNDNKVVEYYQVVRTSYKFIVTDNFITVTYPKINTDNIQTLIPYQIYSFFIHYVKSSGETSNGIYIGDYSYSDVDFFKSGTFPKSANPENVYKYIPKFKISVKNENDSFLPEGYVSCFISVLHKQNDSIFVTGISDFSKINDYDSVKDLYGNSIDLDLNLHSQIANYTNFKCGERNLLKENGVITYRHSSDFNYKRTVGNSGKIVIKPDDYKDVDFKYYYNSSENKGFDGFIITPTFYDSDTAILTKCTPYLFSNNTSYNNINGKYYISYDSSKLLFDVSKDDNVQLNGYISYVEKLLDIPQDHPNYNFGIPGGTADHLNYIGFDSYYSAGLVYKKKVTKTVSTDTGSADIIDLEGPAKENDDKYYSIHYSDYRSTGRYYYTKYNLNFLELREDIKTTLLSSGNPSKTLISYGLESLTFSDIYKLPSMYKNLTNKPFVKFDSTDVLVEYDNTIRQSKLYGDEEKVYNYYFNPLDYYNTPTNKGKIVLLVNLGEYLLVHTEDTIYRFTGVNTITANGGEEVQLTESNPFESGISEVFGSKQGFGGIQNKYHACATQKGYVFYDSSCRVLYLYNGQQITAISNKISKLFEEYKFDDVAIADDFYNNRLIFSFIKHKTEESEEELEKKSTEEIKATLSYSFITNEFASTHDYWFKRAFNSKTYAYVYNDDILLLESSNYLIPDKDDTIIEKPNAPISNNAGWLYIIDNDYNIQGYTNIDKGLSFTDIIFPSYNYNNIVSKSGFKYSIVDIIVKDDYEEIKALNYVNWICNKHDSYSSLQYNDNTYILANHSDIPLGYGMAEEIIEHDNNNATDVTIGSEAVAKQTPYYKYKGDYIWVYTDSSYSKLISIVDVSNDKNLNDVNNYKVPRYNLGVWTFNYFRNIRGAKYDNGTITNKFNSDNASLIYGKYFVVRLILNPEYNFKLENITINYSD